MAASTAQIRSAGSRKTISRGRNWHVNGYHQKQTFDPKIHGQTDQQRGSGKDSGSRQLMEAWDVPQGYACQGFVILGYINGEQPQSKPRKTGRVKIIEA